MLASNIMLGQGPYTPWQMAAWGLVGLAGAALGGLSRRRLSRVPLALACACAALMAKEIMNVYEWTLGASHTPAAFLAIAGTSVPYDITDTVATLLFALAFGPELARLLARTRERMTIEWDPRPPDSCPPDSCPLTSAAPQSQAQQASAGGGVAPGGVAPRAASIAPAILVLLAITALASGGVVARADTRAAAANTTPSARAASLSPELSYLTSAQNADGGYGAARGQGSSELYTAWAAIGLAAAGRDPAGVSRGGHTVLDSLRGEASTLQGLGDAERTILAAHACGASAYSFAGRDLVAEVLRARGRGNSFEDQVNLTAFAIFALRAAGHSAGFGPIREAAGWIERQQNSDGGFSFGVHGSPSDVDDTGAALQALADAGARNRGVLGAAADYLVRSQNLDGGLPQQYGGQSNAQSTAWAIQGVIAAGYDPATVRRGASRSPVGYLESLVAPGGSVRYSRTVSQTPVWVTAQALIALAGRMFPVGP